MVVQSPSQVSFENPAMASMYDSHPHAANQMHPQLSGQYMQHMNGHVQAVSDEKAAWGAQMFGAQVTGVFTLPRRRITPRTSTRQPLSSRRTSSTSSVSSSSNSNTTNA